MKSPPGRPKGTSNAREQLTKAARELFLHSPYEQVSIRQIARTANVDSALIRYYFDDKAGLFETMVRETIAPFLAALDNNKYRQNKDQMDTETLIAIYYRILGTNPALPKLIFRVLNDNPKSKAFSVLARIFSEVLEKARGWIQNTMVDSGQLQPGVDPALARLSLISLMAFPLIAPPILLKELGFTINQSTLATIAKHSAKLISQGLLIAQESSNE